MRRSLTEKINSGNLADAWRANTPAPCATAPGEYEHEICNGGLSGYYIGCGNSRSCTGWNRTWTSARTDQRAGSNTADDTCADEWRVPVEPLPTQGRVGLDDEIALPLPGAPAAGDGIPAATSVQSSAAVPSERRCHAVHSCRRTHRHARAALIVQIEAEQPAHEREPEHAEQCGREGRIPYPGDSRRLEAGHPP